MSFHRTNNLTECGLTPATYELLQNLKTGKTKPFNDAAYSLTPPKKEYVREIEIKPPAPPLTIQQLDALRDSFDTQAEKVIQTRSNVIRLRRPTTSKILPPDLTLQSVTPVRLLHILSHPTPERN